RSTWPIRTFGRACNPAFGFRRLVVASPRLRAAAEALIGSRLKMTAAINPNDSYDGTNPMTKIRTLNSHIKRR
ncbi:hypothetical protein WNX13_10480, partial [Lactobacillus delbrueckii]|uniref:hypothetical protein n=1 Tax=Lactobacillus delbrueckii TaxID=1584 RepID=UPI0030E7C15E